MNADQEGRLRLSRSFIITTKILLNNLRILNENKPINMTPWDRMGSDITTYYLSA